jgi:hypothetical protein
MRVSLVSVLVLVALACAAQTNNQTSTVCTFDNGQQISIRYSRIPYDKGSSPPQGQPWSPGDQPIYLFSQTTLKAGTDTIPPGAYRLFIVPGKESWQVAINRDVQQGAKYEKSQDAARIPAQTGQLPSPANKLTLYFGHLAPEKCALRIDYGPQRAYTDFTQETTSKGVKGNGVGGGS